MDISEEVTATLRAQEHGHPPCVLAAGFCKECSAQSRGIGYEEERAPTLRAGAIPTAVYENHSQDTRYTGPLDTAPTVSSTYGTGGNNQPFVVEANTLKTLKIRSGCEGGGKGPLVQEDISATLSCNNDQTLFVPKTYAVTTGSYTQVSEEQAPTLMARDFKDPAAVNRGYSVRRLTPTECSRLQGFPDGWCANLDTPEPTEEDIAFWTEVWETHRRVMGHSSRPKSRNQIVKWLRHPHSDSAEYAMWGNGVTLPNVFFVLADIVWAAQLSGQ